MEDIIVLPETVAPPEADRRLHDMAMMTIQLCLANVVVVFLFAVVVVVFYPGMFDEPRSDGAVSIFLVAGTVALLAIIGFIIIGITNARLGVVLPWIERGGKMP